MVGTLYIYLHSVTYTHYMARGNDVVPCYWIALENRLKPGGGDCWLPLDEEFGQIFSWGEVEFFTKPVAADFDTPCGDVEQ